MVSISLVTDFPDEADVARRVQALLDRHDLRKWQFTDKVQIEQGVLSHSHPILTITAPFAEPLPGDTLLLATYLHFTIAYFEYRALIDILGPDDARRVIEYKLQRPFYRYVYRTTLHDFDRMTAVFDRHGITL